MKEKNNAEKSTGSPFFIIFIFIVLIAIVNYAPKMYQKYNDYVSNKSQFGENNKKQNVSRDIEVDSESDFISIGSSQTVDFNEIKISNVSLDENTLTFTLSSEKKVDLDKSNYYVEVYNSNYAFKGRRILKGIVDKSENVSVSLSNTDVANVVYVKLVRIEDSAIPKTTFNSDESGIVTIECARDNDSYTYDFQLDKLIKVVRKYTYTSSEEDLDEYANKKLEYQKLVNSNNKIQGITSDIVDSGNTFIYTVEVNFDEVEIKNLEDEYFNKKDSKPYIVKYKLEAEGFVCTQK